METGVIEVGTELFNLGVGALSLIVMYALIRLISDVNKANRERNDKSDETEKIHAQTNLKLAEGQLQQVAMFDKLEASIAYNASATQKQTATLEDIKADGRRQIEALADIKNTISPATVAAAIQSVQQPTFDKAITQHNEIITGIDDTKNTVQTLVQGQTEIMSKLATLPEDVKATIRVEIDTVLAKISLIDELFTSLKPQLTAIQNEMKQRLPLPDVDRVPPKTETTLLTPVIGDVL